MDWGVELWDQFENVDKHHQYGIEYARKYAKFVKERCVIEMEYAAKLKKLVKGYQPRKKDEERSMFSTHKAFQSQLSELVDVASQHEVIAEEMLANINKSLLLLCNDLEIEKKKLFQDGRHQQVELDQQEKSMENTKRKFEKEWKECEKAQAYFDKLDNDINVTKIDVEKARNAWNAKKNSVEGCKTDYAAALQNYNKFQENHYTVNMPKLFQTYKNADEKRIMRSRDYMMEFSKIELKLQPLILKCLEGMEKAAGAIDANLDAQLVVDKLKSGFPIPSDKEFEDFTQPQTQRLSTSDGFDASNKNNLSSNRPSNKKGLSRFFGGNKKLTKDLPQEIDHPVPRSSSISDLSRNGNSDTSDNPNNAALAKDTLHQQKARTLSITKSKSYATGIASRRGSEKMRSENRSSSHEILPKNDNDKPDVEAQPRKSLKTLSKHLDFRKSMPVNKKMLKSMFRSNKEGHAPKIEPSGPITCDLMNTSVNDDYLVPITSQTELSKAEFENPYDEVADIPVDDSTSGVSVQVESRDYSHLPPEQRRKKLQKALVELRKDLSKEEEARKALLQMQDVYRANPAMGDADTVTQQISASTTKIEKLYDEISQLESCFAAAGGKDQKRKTQSSTKSKTHPSSSNVQVSEPVGTNNVSATRDQSFGDDFDEDQEPIGTCVALYDFEATSEGALTMRCGEKFSVIEADNGDGWTRAMRGDVDGYVPTSYVEIEFFT